MVHKGSTFSAGKISDSSGMQIKKLFYYLLFLLIRPLRAVLIEEVILKREPSGFCANYNIRKIQSQNLWSCGLACRALNMFCIGICFDEGEEICHIYSTENYNDTTYIINYFGYTYFDFASTMDEAEAKCQDIGASLAFPLSNAELSYVYQLPSRTYLGITYTSVGKRWERITDGVPAQFFNWDGFQPDNFGGNEHCAAINQNGKWNDMPCSVKERFVCQFPVPGACTNGFAGSGEEGQKCFIKLN